jgi:hypothetical protein
VGSSLFGEASASWRRSAQHSAAHALGESPKSGSGAYKAEELGELQLDALSSQGEPLGFLSEDEEEPLDLLEPPKLQGKQARALRMEDDDDLFGGTDDGAFRLDDDEVPFSDDPYLPSKPHIPKPAALKSGRAQEQSLFDFSDEGYSLDPHDELSLPSEDALELDAPIPPPRGAAARPKAGGAYNPRQLGLDDAEDRFGEEDIYDLDLPSELPPKGSPKAPPPKGKALSNSLDDSLGAISDLPPVKTEREEHDVSRIYQEEDLDLDPMYTQDLEPPRPSGSQSARGGRARP